MIRIIILLLISFSCCGQSDFNGCPSIGDNHLARVQAADALKNRIFIEGVIYAETDIGFMLSLKVVDTFSQSAAVVVKGYILDIKDGGSESCNCHSKTNKDTHIYLVADSSVTDASKAIIVEVTPRFRALLGTTAELKAKYLHRNVSVSGYLFRDEEHKQNSAADDGKGLLWRGSVWEIHPVTDIVLR